MAITYRQPNTIYLGGPAIEIGNLAAEAAICPGMLVERHLSSTVIRWRKHGTAAVATARAVACEASDINKNVNDGYSTGENVRVVEGAGGTAFWMLIASGQNISAGVKLESAGDGTLRVLNAGVALFSALESVDNTNGDAGPTNPPVSIAGTTTALPTGAARIRVEVV